MKEMKLDKTTEKYKVAVELGLENKIIENGWKGLTAKESGRIGGIISKRHRIKGLE